MNRFQPRSTQAFSPITDVCGSFAGPIAFWAEAEKDLCKYFNIDLEWRILAMGSSHRAECAQSPLAVRTVGL
jgi:hypothetical protein